MAGAVPRGPGSRIKLAAGSSGDCRCASGFLVFGMSFVYGALAGEQGIVNVSWAADRVFRMSWQETGGPAPQPPVHRGFGSRVLVEMAKHQLDAVVRLEYPAHGVLWHVEAPLERVGDLLPGSSGPIVS